VNHTRFPKKDHLLDWARRYNKVIQGDRVEIWIQTRPTRTQTFFMTWLKKYPVLWKRKINSLLMTSRGIITKSQHFFFSGGRWYVVNLWVGNMQLGMARVSTRKVSKLLCVCVCVCERERERVSVQMGTWPRHFYFAPRKNRGMYCKYVFTGRRHSRCCNSHTPCVQCGGQCWLPKKCVREDGNIQEKLEEVRLMPNASDVPQDQAAMR